MHRWSQAVKTVLEYLFFLNCTLFFSSAVFSFPVQRLRFDKHEIREVCKSETKAEEKKCANAKRFFAPADSTFVIVGQEKKNLYLQFRNVSPEVREARQRKLPLVEQGPTKYHVTTDDLPESDYKFYHGLTHGPLAIPMKLQLADGNISPGGNIGYFVGYRFLTHVTVIPIALGFGAVNVGSPNTTELKPQAAFTIAAGIEYDLSQNNHNLGQGVQLGIFIGVDHSNGYGYSDKPWLAIGAGYNFDGGSD